jgi:hypothetical protein
MKTIHVQVHIVGGDSKCLHESNNLMITYSQTLMKINPTKIVHEVMKWVDNEVKRPSRVNTRDIHPRVSQVNRRTEMRTM